MNPSLEFLDRPHTVTDGPTDIGAEQRWQIRLQDGQTAVVGQLAPDLAKDGAIRRRYVRDIERLRQLQVHSLAPVIATGPAPDPRDPRALPPWRMRLDPAGSSLRAWLARAPCPLDEFAEVFAKTADAVHAIHSAGAVIRDLQPEQIIRTQQGHIILSDIGLARVDVLSSHTASSLLLQGSSYHAPEQLFKTLIDQRSDVYGLGVMMWEALTGELPFGDQPALLTERHELPSLATIRSDVPSAVDALVRSCLAQDPQDRPDSVSEIGWVLRGGARVDPRDEGKTTCQHCASPLHVGQRLCLTCGRVAVRFQHAPRGETGYGIDLLALDEDAQRLKWLEDFLDAVSRHPMRSPQFVIGSVHMYSEEERASRIRLPARLYNNIDRRSAEQMAELMREQGLKVRIVSPSAATNLGKKATMGAAASVFAAIATGLVGLPALAALVPAIAVTVFFLMKMSNAMTDRRKLSSFGLRELPAALPASDPFVRRLAKMLDDQPPADVRSIVSELALIVQRLVDHRAKISNTRELDVLTAPVEPLVVAVEKHVHQLATLSAELSELNEGTIVRALSVSEARGDSEADRKPLYAGLDRLRTLEDQRATLFHRLLEAKVLLQRTVALGLSVQDPVAQSERSVQLALATLGSS